MNLKKSLEEAGIDTHKGLFLVYGGAGTGKTTFMMESTGHIFGKAFIIDSERGFSIDRFKQISNEGLDSLMIARPESLEEQAKIISNILDNEKLFGFIGIDTIGKHYREEAKKDRKKSNNEMARQMRVLKEISRTKPVVICNQVYQNISENRVEPLAGNYVTKWCDVVIELDEVNNVRKFKLIKPEVVEKEFKLCDRGFEF
jgi:RecA/RadA recombinase